MVVLWSQSAKTALRQAFEYIATDSLQAAQAVINEIVDATLIWFSILNGTIRTSSRKTMMVVGVLLNSIDSEFLIK